MCYRFIMCYYEMNLHSIFIYLYSLQSYHT
jgi:hypothetical protein